MRLRVFNFSDVYGGQEVYLCTLLNWLQARNEIQHLTFVGGPASLMSALSAVRSVTAPCSVRRRVRCGC